MDEHQRELAQGTRFAFGENWRRFLTVLDEERIRAAEQSLRELLGLSSLAGKSFLDVGSGSGLFSLAARRLGARVVSFDYDPASVACTDVLRQLYFPHDPQWSVARASVLDQDYLASLGQFDVVYSWGVLHHTGQLWQALTNVLRLVADEGRLAIALYNDQGWRSKFWLRVKQAYGCCLPGRACVLVIFLPMYTAGAVLKGLVRTGLPWSHFTQYRQRRGMSIVHDWIDWLGGLPFEVSSAARVIEHCEAGGCRLLKLKATRRSGNNEFLFLRTAAGPPE